MEWLRKFRDEMASELSNLNTNEFGKSISQSVEHSEWKRKFSKWDRY